MAKRTVITLILLAVSLAAFAEEKQSFPRIDGARILMIIARRDFRDEEIFQPRQIFLQQGAQVRVASSSIKEARGMLGGKFKPEMLIADAKPDKFDAIIFVGGMGAKEYWDSPVAHSLAKEAFKQGKLVAAICFAPVTLARARLLKGRKATVWKSEAPQLQKGGAKYTGTPVQIDGRIITANGPKAAGAFAFAVVKALAESKKPKGSDNEDREHQQERSD